MSKCSKCPKGTYDHLCCEAVEPDVFKHASRAGKVVAETDKMICAGCGDCFVGVHWLDQDGKTQCPGCYFARFDNRDKG